MQSFAGLIVGSCEGAIVQILLNTSFKDLSNALRVSKRWNKHGSSRVFMSKYNDIQRYQFTALMRARNDHAICKWLNYFKQNYGEFIRPECKKMISLVTWSPLVTSEFIGRVYEMCVSREYAREKFNTRISHKCGKYGNIARMDLIFSLGFGCVKTVFQTVLWIRKMDTVEYLLRNYSKHFIDEDWHVTFDVALYSQCYSLAQFILTNKNINQCFHDYGLFEEMLRKRDIVAVMLLLRDGRILPSITSKVADMTIYMLRDEWKCKQDEEMRGFIASLEAIATAGEEPSKNKKVRKNL